MAVERTGHGDLAPWNIVFRGTDVVGLIDWDAAGPSSRAWDLCHAAIQLVPFHAPHERDGLNLSWSRSPGRRWLRPWATCTPHRPLRGA